MLALWVLGPQLELALGRVRFLALYLLSGLAGSAAVLWLSPVNSQTLGASGAIFGLMGALMLVALKVHGDVRSVAMWIGANFVLTFLLVGQISWQGHLGGFVGGVLLGAGLIYAPRNNRTMWQALAVSAVALLIAVATVARVAALS
jgi:membrane associated rhomboid family serine protease